MKTKKTVFKRVLPCIIFSFLLPIQVHAADDPCLVPDACIAVDFDKARLSEVAFLVSELTGAGFVFDEAARNPAVSWTQSNVPKVEVLPYFIKVLTSLGLTVHRVDASNFWAIRTDPALVAGVEATGIYHLTHIDAEVTQKAAEALYGKRLVVYGSKGTKVVVFAGDPDLVHDFIRTLEEIDQPAQVDSGFTVIPLRHISVRHAMAAVDELKIFTRSSPGSGSQSSSGSAREQSGVYPDYWQRSVVVRGTKAQQALALEVLSALDKPKQGYVDELVFLTTLNVADAVDLLQDMYESLVVRQVASDRLLISGDAALVDQAQAMLRLMDGSGLQVQVEAVIASLTDKEFRELGTRIGTQRSEFVSSLNTVFPFGTPYPGILLDYFKESLAVSFAAGDGFSTGQVVSSPVLKVLNGTEARLVVGHNVPFLSRTSKKDGHNDYDYSQSVSRQDVGLSFFVRPVIRPDGDFITLTIEQEISSVNPESQLGNAVDLIVDKKSLSTTVLVGNGDMIFLGGLRYEEAGKSVDMVPVIGELPLLGSLFTYKSEVTYNRNLVIGIRVQVVSIPEIYSDISFKEAVMQWNAVHQEGEVIKRLAIQQNGPTESSFPSQEVEK